jgi:hypothetical protein
VKQRDFEAVIDALKIAKSEVVLDGDVEDLSIKISAMADVCVTAAELHFVHLLCPDGVPDDHPLWAELGDRLDQVKDVPDDLPKEAEATSEGAESWSI